jgi:hypothetical protein
MGIRPEEDRVRIKHENRRGRSWLSAEIREDLSDGMGGSRAPTSEKIVG